MKEIQRFYFLDGIRGWAALTVLLDHLFCTLPVSEKSVKILQYIPLFNGRLAVTLFFIVSGFSLSAGFCLTRSHELITRISLGRYFRLTIPILAVSFLTFLAFWFELIPAIGYRPNSYQGFLITTPTIWETMVTSLYNVYFDSTKSQLLIPSIWTMTYECWGSCLILAILAIFGKLQNRIVIYLSLIIIAYFIGTFPYYSTFLVGLVFAEIYTEQIFSLLKKYANIFAKLLLIPAVYLCIRQPQTNFIFYLLGPCLLIFCLIFNSWTSKFLSNKLSRFLGSISYPLYLSHVLILYVFNIKFQFILHILHKNSFSWRKLLLHFATKIQRIMVAK